MKYVRFELAGSINYGLLIDDIVEILQGDIFGEYSSSGITVPLNSVNLLAPCLPTKAVCVGLNYRDHAKEMKLEQPKQPLLFLKPSSALNAPNLPIVYPTITKNLHYEAELAVVIKKIAKNIPVDKAEEYILGYTCANDVTARDLQLADGQWTRGKSFDTFLPIGPCIAVGLDPHNLKIELKLNGIIKQTSNTANLIFTIPELVCYITQVMTLLPGDIILTGTPAGVGSMDDGDIVVVEIEGIGQLTNEVLKNA